MFLSVAVEGKKNHPWLAGMLFLPSPGCVRMRMHHSWQEGVEKDHTEPHTGIFLLSNNEMAC